MMSRAAQLLFGAAVLFAILPATGQAQRVQRVRPIRPRTTIQNGPQMPDVLRRVVTAAGSIHLYGERIVDQRVQGELQRHTEVVYRIGFRTRITFPDGSRFGGQIIVDDGTTRRRYTPRNQQINEQPSQRDDVLSRLVGPKNQLLTPRVALLDGGVVAGVRTTLANILDRNGQTVQALYIDPSTGAVLKRVGYDKNGAVIANYEFTSVSYNPSSDTNAFSLPRVARTITPAQTLRNMSKSAGLPALMIRPGQGFNLANSRLQMRGNVQVLHQVYLGPSGRLSVFVLRAQIDPAKLVDRSGKFINAYATQSDGATIAFVGPYTQDELKRLSTTLVTP